MVWTRGLALAGIVWCAGLLVATTLPGGLRWPLAVVALSTALPVVPGFVAVLLAGIRRTTGLQAETRAGQAKALWRLVRDTLPGWLLVASGLLFAGFWVVAVLTLTGSPGVAEEQAGTYVLNNNGETTVISEAEYLSRRARESRLVAAVAGCFSVAVAVISTALLRRKADKAVHP
ncbi:hypothetical protein OWR29_46455 [Actinoplanes sp. Pm04-4]|uniref:Uncharacterized protein n=1 Tax=Paractinoplanes pyxinae TaxID=2997416 RepID=A0ABT4BG18_9ACTN|nr:hypothetical protein [Actinoplanes pyxinae]MCY1145492.1 hypothetical protein [Actinoplanes pyxinae]